MILSHKSRSLQRWRGACCVGEAPAALARRLPRWRGARTWSSCCTVLSLPQESTPQAVYLKYCPTSSDRQASTLEPGDETCELAMAIKKLGELCMQTTRLTMICNNFRKSGCDEEALRDNIELVQLVKAPAFQTFFSEVYPQQYFSARKER